MFSSKVCPSSHTNNKRKEFYCFYCYFFSLNLFSAVIYKRRGKKLISKTIKYKLDSSSKMQFFFFYPKDIQNFFGKTIDFVENLEMEQIAGGRGGRHVHCVILTQCVRSSICDSLLKRNAVKRNVKKQNRNYTRCSA